jgi:hypothetical protein
LGDLQQTKQNIFQVEPHLPKKKKMKKQNTETLNPQPIKFFSNAHYTEKPGEFHHWEMPTPNLSRICCQTGLDAKVVTPDLLRLKFYCS